MARGNGKLWSSLNKVVKPANGAVKAAAAYFIVEPTWSGSTLGSSIANQGYFSLSNHALVYPSIGVVRGAAPEGLRAQESRHAFAAQRRKDPEKALMNVIKTHPTRLLRALSRGLTRFITLALALSFAIASGAQTLTKSFSPTIILSGGTTVLTFTVTMPAGTGAVSNVGFVDALPSGLRVASVASVGGTCVNAAAATTATPGSSTVTVTNLQVPAGASSCTVTVRVTNAAGQTNASCGSNPAPFTNTSANVTVTNVINGVTPNCLTVASSCTYSLSPLDLSNLAKAGGTPSVIVTTPAGCPVTVNSFQPWVSVNSIAPSGSETTVSLQIGANTGAARATSIVVADRLYLITQQPGP